MNNFPPEKPEPSWRYQATVNRWIAMLAGERWWNTEWTIEPTISMQEHKRNIREEEICINV